jgi:glyceraldehyde-3-phosphate dehydrogenase (NADP+)
MSPAAPLSAMFPTSDAVPPQARPPSPTARILVNGELRLWDGPRREISSPLWLRAAADAEPTAPVLGEAPSVSVEVALEALAAARRAWSFGTGAWPTMRVEDRIEAVEKVPAWHGRHARAGVPPDHVGDRQELDRRPGRV